MIEHISAVLFDFDETLQDRQKAYSKYCAFFVDSFFPHLSPGERARHMDDMERTVNGGYIDRRVYFSQLFELWQWADHPPVEELIEHYDAQFGRFTSVFPEAEAMLSELKRRGYRLGIVTNGPARLQNAKLDTSGLRPYMDTIVVSGQFGIHKPDRRIFDHAAANLGVDNARCLYVGDHPVNDIQGALGAGMRAVWMSYGTFREARVDASIPKLTKRGALPEL
ncbi:MAG: HAD family hydrolase [Clostridiales bacterium]|nr:HAD family hydrolase [Clostridiales bacterium]